MVDQPFATLKDIYDHLAQSHFNPAPVKGQNLPPQLRCGWGNCDDDEIFDDVEQFRQHVDRHFGGALRALWEPAESLKEVRRALSVLLQTTASIENQENAPAPELEPAAGVDEDEEDFDGWCLEWELSNKQQQKPIKIENQKTKKEKNATEISEPPAKELPEQILEIVVDSGGVTGKKSAFEAAQETAEQNSERNPEPVETPAGVRRSSRQKKPTIRFEDLEAQADRQNENEDENGMGEKDESPQRQLSKTPRRGKKKIPMTLPLQQNDDDRPSAVVVMEILTDQKKRQMQRMMPQHVLFVPEVSPAFSLGLYSNRLNKF